VVTDPLYQAVFPNMRLARETDIEIHTTLRGRRYATSIGEPSPAEAAISSSSTIRSNRATPRPT